MVKESIQKLCYKLELGKLCSSPEQIFGGLLHEMYKIETTIGIYAVKALNPNIMKREKAIRNYIFSEKVASIAYLNNIPAVPAIESENCLYYIDGSYYMVFEWVLAKSLLPTEVTSYHCITIGKILAQIHNIDFSRIAEKEINTPLLTVTEWGNYTGVDAFCSIELSKIEHLLFEWERQANLSARNVFSHQIISHRDMDCKNVLWDKNNSPIIIDWEAAGYINPLQELIEVALAWSGLETEDFNSENFKVIVESYVKNGGIIVDDITAVLSFGYKGKLEWLEYNIKRSLGIESNSKTEQELGTKEVIKTINTIKNYERLIPTCIDIIKNYMNF